MIEEMKFKSCSNLLGRVLLSQWWMIFKEISFKLSVSFLKLSVTHGARTFLIGSLNTFWGMEVELIYEQCYCRQTFLEGLREVKVFYLEQTGTWLLPSPVGSPAKSLIPEAGCTSYMGSFPRAPGQDERVLS